VLGSGISGLLHIALAKSLGAGRIIASDINEYRMNAARKFGADYVFHASDDIPGRIRDVNDGRFVDVAIICTGAISAHEQAMKSIDWGGTILLFGVAALGEIWQFPVFNFWRNGSRMISSYGGAPVDIEQAIELIRFNRIDVESMITHRLPLGEIQKGFDLVSQSNESIKVIIEPHMR
jgi:L-iditol 2-dehydrogenase